MKSDKSLVEFLKRVERGRKFEEWERSHWKDGINSGAEFEVFTQLKGKRGRVDIRLGLDEDGQIVIVEIKATDWDNIKADKGKENSLTTYAPNLALY